MPRLLEKSYEHPIWEEKAERCYSCASCNLVCPTCYCFDVYDDVDWTLQVEKSRSLMDKLLGRNKMASDDPLSALVESLARADASIRDVAVDRGA